MKYIFTLLLFFIAVSVDAQHYNELLLRKNGITIKRFREGAEIHIQSKLGMDFSGVIYLIQNDSVYFSNGGLHINDIKKVYKKLKRPSSVIPFDNQTFLYANLGIPLFAGGLIIRGEPVLKSILVGVGLVYVPVLVYNIKRIVSRNGKKYKMGNKYDLLVLDIHPAEIVPLKNQ